MNLHLLYPSHEAAIGRIAAEAARLHESVNQTYGEGLPYAFHLELAASYAARFGHLVIRDEDEVETLFAAIYFHDALEDTRLTYHDLLRVLQRLNVEGCAIHTDEAAELVYALTNDKGRTREERAGERYYEGIRGTRHASFLKMCDRLANIRYSTLFGLPGRMARVYREEMPHFLDSIGPVPDVMKEEALRMLDEVMPQE